MNEITVIESNIQIYKYLVSKQQDLNNFQQPQAGNWFISILFRFLLLF